MDRTFLIQMFAILQEFGGQIPWLEPCEDALWYVHQETFLGRILSGLGVKSEHISPFALLDQENQYLGGILHFGVSPEKFRDPKSITTQERLESEGYSYLTCLQIRDKFQGRGLGRTVMLEVLSLIHQQHSKVWAVVSDNQLVHWYTSLGFKVEQTADTRDGLWIISRREATHI